MAEFSQAIASKGTKEEQDWSEKINKSLHWRAQTSKESCWKRFQRYWDHVIDNPQQPHFNLIYLTGASMIPSLVFQNPSVVNTPRRPEFVYWAQFFDSVDNWLIDEMEVKHILEDAVLTAYLCNNVGLEMGYDFPSTKQMRDEGSLQFDDVVGTVDRARKTNQPFIEMIHPKQLLVAPRTRTMRNCQYYAKYKEVRTKDLEAMRQANPGRFRNIQATHQPQRVKTSASDDRSKEIEDYTGMWIIHNAEDKKWSWLGTHGKYILPPEEDPRQVDGLPLEMIAFNKGSRGIWGTPDVSYIESQHIEGEESRRDGRIQSRSANVKGFYDTNLLEEEDIEKFITSDALGMIPVEVPQDKNLDNVIKLVQPHVQMERFEYQKNLMNDAQLLVGQGPNQMGTFAPGRRSKFEAQLVEENSFLRTGSRRLALADCTGRLMGRINQMIMQNWKEPMVQLVVGMEGAMHWVSAKPSEFNEVQAQLVSSVNVESLAPTSRERRKQEMVEVMGVLGKMSGNIPGMVLLPIVQNFLSQFEWAQVSKILPMAGTGQETMAQFQGQQQQMLQGGQGAQQLQQNLGSMQGLMQRLPSVGEQNGGQ